MQWKLFCSAAQGKKEKKQIRSWYMKSIDFPCIVKITKKPNEEASQYTKLSSKECHGQEEGEKWRGMINNQIVYWSLSWNSLSCTAQGQLRGSSSGAILLSAALSKCRERMGKKYQRAEANGRAAVYSLGQLQWCKYDYRHLLDSNATLYLLTHTLSLQPLRLEACEVVIPLTVMNSINTVTL